MVIAYPQPHKAKSLLICTEFIDGCGGTLRHSGEYANDADAAFYGTVGIENLFYRAQRNDLHDWYYIDNAYFDSLRGQYFRVGKNATQTYQNAPDYARMEAMGVKVRPWRERRGSAVIVVEQSDYFMRYVARWGGGIAAWRAYVLDKLRTYARERVVVIRRWERNKSEQQAAFARELDKAWIVVTHSSAAACEAVLQGVPAIATDVKCAASFVTGSFERIESPLMPNDDERERWAASLCGLQWTLDEIREGKAWDALRKL